MIHGLEARMAVIGHVKIGGRKMIGSGRTIPEKYDHIVVTTAQTTDLGYEIDESLMDRLVEVGGDEDRRVRRLMVMLPSDDPEENLITSLAVYDGQGCRCRGDGQRGVFLHPASGKRIEVKCPCNMLRSRLNPIDDPELRAPHPVRGMQPNFERGFMCKPHGILRMMVLEARTLGGIHVFRTTSINSIRQLTAAMHQIRQLTGGALAFIPLQFEVTPKRVSPGPNQQQRTVYVVNLTYKADMMDFLKEMVAQVQLRSTLQRQIATENIKSLPAIGDEDREEQRVIAEEFHATDVIEIDERPEPAPKTPDDITLDDRANPVCCDQRMCFDQEKVTFACTICTQVVPAETIGRLRDAAGVAPATKEQRALLERRGVQFDPSRLTNGQAEKLIKDSGDFLATPTQLDALKALGVDHGDPERLLKADATEMIYEARAKKEAEEKTAALVAAQSATDTAHAEVGTPEKDVSNEIPEAVQEPSEAGEAQDTTMAAFVEEAAEEAQEGASGEEEGEGNGDSDGKGENEATSQPIESTTSSDGMMTADQRETLRALLRPGASIPEDMTRVEATAMIAEMKKLRGEEPQKRTPPEAMDKMSAARKAGSESLVASGRGDMETAKAKAEEAQRLTREALEAVRVGDIDGAVSKAQEARQENVQGVEAAIAAKVAAQKAIAPETASGSEAEVASGAEPTSDAPRGEDTEKLEPAPKTSNGFPECVVAKPDGGDERPALKTQRVEFIKLGNSKGFDNGQLRTWIRQLWGVENTAALMTWQVDAMMSALGTI